MLSIDRARKVLRTLLAVLAVVTLIAACSSDKGTKDAKGAASTTSSTQDRSGQSRLTKAVAKDPCALLQRADLSKVTGISFDRSDPGVGYCAYTSTQGLAAITLHYTSLDGADPTVAIDQTMTSCDPGSATRLQVPGAQGAYRCTVKGVASVGVTGSGVFAVLLGATLRTDVPTSRILDDLATIMEHALAAQS